MKKDLWGFTVVDRLIRHPLLRLRKRIYVAALRAFPSYREREAAKLFAHQKANGGFRASSRYTQDFVKSYKSYYSDNYKD